MTKLNKSQIIRETLTRWDRLFHPLNIDENMWPVRKFLLDNLESTIQSTIEAVRLEEMEHSKDIWVMGYRTAIADLNKRIEEFNK